MLDALEQLGLAQVEASRKNSSSGTAGGGTASTSSSANLGEADPAEAPACLMLALGGLSRVLTDFCQQLAGAVGSTCSSGSSAICGVNTSM